MIPCPKPNPEIGKNDPLKDPAKKIADAISGESGTIQAAISGQARLIQTAGVQGIGTSGGDNGLAGSKGLQEAQPQIKEQVKQDANAIHQIGQSNANNIAGAIGDTNNKPWIQVAISDHSRTIEKAGGESTKERRDKIEQLSDTMGCTIMRELYEQDKFGVGGQITSQSQNLVGSLNSPDQIGTNGITPKAEDILKIIQNKAPGKSAKEVKDNARQIAAAIVNITEIKREITTALTGNVNVSFGLMRATMRYILIVKATDIATALEKQEPEHPSGVATQIKEPLNSENEAQKTIAKAMFAVVISEIIRNNAKDIAEQTTSSRIQGTIASKATTQITSADTRKQMLVKFLAPSSRSMKSYTTAL